jgi:hypothetical protein
MNRDLSSLLVHAMILGFPLTGPIAPLVNGLDSRTTSRKFRTMALEMRPACEACGAGLPFDAVAYICSYECTFCQRCAESGEHACPNCGGELVRRPRRASE